MYFDRPLVEFKLDESDHIESHQLEKDPKYYPFEMKCAQTADRLLSFFKERVTPPTRDGLMEDLRISGFSQYSIAALLITSNGRDCQDCYWVRFNEGPQTWNEAWEAMGMPGYLSSYRETLQGDDLPCEDI